jgi:hypothetical protein
MQVHSNEGDVIKMQQNLVTIVLMSYALSKLYVDIKFDIFNLKGMGGHNCERKRLFGFNASPWLTVKYVLPKKGEGTKI